MRSAISGCQLCAAVFCGINEQLQQQQQQKEPEQSGLNNHNKNEPDNFQIYCKAVRRKRIAEDVIDNDRQGSGWPETGETSSEGESKESLEEEFEDDLSDSNGSYLHLVFSSERFGEMDQFLPKQSVIDNSIEIKFGPKHGLKIPRSCRSPACFDMISQWRRNCRDNHKICSSDSEDPERMPTRVLDIGDQVTPPRLLVTKDEQEPYATLSYCWGDPAEFKQPITTMSNLKHREEVLYLTTLPPVFQDAITITRKLGFRYLWIDSLCIIQDSTDDWNAEASEMQQCYKRSSANIIAAAAKNPTYGIFDSADCEREEIIYRVGVGRGFYRECHTNEKYRNFVRKRAWAFQEELLSPWSVIYTDANIRWLCSQDFLSEACLPRGHCGGNNHREAKKQLFALPEYTRNKGDGDEVHDLFFTWWYQVLNNYMERELSVITDRLPAIAGLAKEFGTRIKTPTDSLNERQYYWGLWKKDFVRGLCWNGHGARIQQYKHGCSEGNPPEYLGPSWSWATLDPGKIGGRFLYDHLLEFFEFDLMADDDRALKNFEIHVEGGEGGDEYGVYKLEKAVLVLEGVCRDFHTYCEPRYIDSSLEEYRELCKQLYCTLDEQSGRKEGYPELPHPPGTIYLHLARWRFRRPEEMHPDAVEEISALLLEPTGKKNRGHIEYRRVGLVVFPPDDELAEEGWTRQKVTII
ncbi:heterokaryon incompatibility protein-domain-containing protein [Rhexocercosporidium sp. MPI-PUGE-AT-0058]|nr:heterokaryon incompatibility protein-domain-containing protein [Rhexocercosporidium sp. MPI-PUGE-AT-0058]